MESFVKNKKTSIKIFAKHGESFRKNVNSTIPQSRSCKLVNLSRTRPHSKALGKFFDDGRGQKEDATALIEKKNTVPRRKSSPLVRLAVQRNPDTLVERTVSQNGSASSEQADQAGTDFCVHAHLSA